MNEGGAFSCAHGKHLCTLATVYIIPGVCAYPAMPPVPSSMPGSRLSLVVPMCWRWLEIDCTPSCLKFWSFFSFSSRGLPGEGCSAPNDMGQERDQNQAVVSVLQGDMLCYSYEVLLLLLLLLRMDIF